MSHVMTRKSLTYFDFHWLDTENPSKNVTVYSIYNDSTSRPLTSLRSGFVTFPINRIDPRGENHTLESNDIWQDDHETMTINKQLCLFRIIDNRSIEICLWRLLWWIVVSPIMNGGFIRVGGSFFRDTETYVTFSSMKSLHVQGRYRSYIIFTYLRGHTALAGPWNNTLTWCSSRHPFQLECSRKHEISLSVMMAITFYRQ